MGGGLINVLHPLLPTEQCPVHNFTVHLSSHFSSWMYDMQKKERTKKKTEGGVGSNFLYLR